MPEKVVFPGESRAASAIEGLERIRILRAAARSPHGGLQLLTPTGSICQEAGHRKFYSSLVKQTKRHSMR